MLGKTANGLFWMYRYLERAENTARLIETGQRIALTQSGGREGEWRSILDTAGASSGFDAVHDVVSKEAAINWLLRSKDNPSSILSCIVAARLNARLVRAALTHEVWESVNSAYMTAQGVLARRVSERELPKALGTIRQRTALVRGTTHGTMMRNDIYNFARIGTFLERADNTARILDVKYYVLLPSVSFVGSPVDNVQWETILRSVSGYGGYRLSYGNNPNPRDIAQFLILDRRFPRSIAFCAHKLRDNLEYLALDYDGRRPSLDLIETYEDKHLAQSIDDVFDHGLHEFIQSVLSHISRLSGQIEIDYRFIE
jgi:uncharacterized alpha-E superfamily protein